MPSVMVPLSLQAALDNRVAGSVNEHAIGRALAAAEKITWLLPDDRYDPDIYAPAFLLPLFFDARLRVRVTNCIILPHM
jgi:hypothetical protein